MSKVKEKIAYMLGMLILCNLIWWYAGISNEIVYDKDVRHYYSVEETKRRIVRPDWDKEYFSETSMVLRRNRSAIPFIFKTDTLKVSSGSFSRQRY
jgi:hypothetical protein